MKYVGVCFDSGEWAGDLTGLLAAKFADGWKAVGFHISSSESWAEIDLRRSFESRDDAHPSDTFEWAGRLSVAEMEERFGWAQPA